MPSVPSEDYDTICFIYRLFDKNIKYKLTVVPKESDLGLSWILQFNQLRGIRGSISYVKYCLFWFFWVFFGSFYVPNMESNALLLSLFKPMIKHTHRLMTNDPNCG